MAGYDQPIIVKRIKKTTHAHHGGAWKIAYADFVTAMMAFFLLLWLISMTTPEQKKGIADYFAPTNVSESTSGAGGVLGGTAYDTTKDRMSGSPTDAKSLTSPDSERKSGPMVAVRGGDQQRSGPQTQRAVAVDTTSSSQVNLHSQYNENFEGAAASIRQAWQAMPDITEIANDLVLDQTKDGLNIKIEDQDGRPMFPEGSKEVNEPTRKAIAALAPILQKLSNQISIAGYTAAGTKYANPRYGAWELSADRANTVRDILGEFGLSDDHISSVTGKASADPLFPNEPYLAANDRVEITVLYQDPPVPPDLKP
jgi:chemotaxis protein MotB